MFPADWLHTVAAETVTTDRDAYGDATTAERKRTVSGVLYAPEGIQEAPGLPVVGDASLYGEFPPLDADDTVTHGASCPCDGKQFPRGTFQVVGGSKAWPLGTVVPIRRTTAT